MTDVDFAKYRSMISAKVAARKQSRLELEGGVDGEAVHVHSFKKYKQTVRPDNISYVSGSAYFVVNACEGCDRKLKVDYVVNN